ncbi:hypothetical protein RHGRI_009318 [Rhododendron griersonianum]|uniref:Myb-like domain-containing protein n=1 Tax=Rhododendron griersonianum TaxID=479676 RepID=A0AAV6KET1_9ERIC|nr:hypothetical protein RHGRI_009318 [Rhododendron griersonianum]
MKSFTAEEVEHRPFTAEEDELIVKAHSRFGNKWEPSRRHKHGKISLTSVHEVRGYQRRSRLVAVAALPRRCPSPKGVLSPEEENNMERSESTVLFSVEKAVKRLLWIKEAVVDVLNNRAHAMFWVGFKRGFKCFCRNFWDLLGMIILKLG